MKLAKLFGCKPPQIQGGIEIPVDDQPTLLTLIGPMFQRHALFDMPTARTAFRRRKPAGGDEQVSPGVGHLGLEELQQLPHRRIGYRSGELVVGHHPQDVEVFDPDDPARPRQFGAELVLDVPAHVSDLLMLACHLEPLFLIIVTEDGSLGFRIFALLFL